MRTRVKRTIGVSLVAATFVGAIGWMSPNRFYQLSVENDFIKSIKSKLSAYNERLPEERVYLQLDKPMYEPGETVWFSAFLRDGRSMKESKQSDILHVQLINPKGNVEATRNIIASSGIAAGDFNITESMSGGVYKLRAFTNWMKNEGEDNYFEKEIQVQKLILPRLKMKLDFERKAFGAGDEVVAKLELNTNENKPLSNHPIKLVATLAGEQLLVKSFNTDESGLKYLRFTLPKDLKTSDGLLNVMIDYEGSTESVSRSIPIVLNKVDVKLFPEGGDLVEGLESRVAFKALNEFNKPADIEGILVTERGSKVASFKSYHQGMGAFNFTPQEGEKYFVKVTKPEGILQQFELPEVYKRGYTMSVDNDREHELTVSVNTTESEELSVVAQVRGEVYYATALSANKGNNKLTFSTGNFPIGVAQITLFDNKGIARAERLTFVNKDKQLNVAIKTEKEKYLPREKVKMVITVKDERGIPMPANLSLSVVNDQLLSFADDKSGNILSQLLLEQDLKGKIEEPAFYFDKKEVKADQALDYLLMTSGWRRFTWEKLDQPALGLSYLPEKAVIEGTVLDSYTRKPIPRAMVKIVGGRTFIADADGRYKIDGHKLYDPLQLSCGANGYSNGSTYVYAYNNQQNIYLTDVNHRYNYATKGAGVKNRMANRPDAEVAILEEELAPAVPRMVVDKAMQAPAGVEVRREKKNGQLKAAEKQKKDENVQMAEGKLADDRLDMFGAGAEIAFDEDFEPAEQMLQGNYYRAREFSAPTYANNESVKTRTDFRNTIYWNPNVKVGNNGRAIVEFYTSDDITSFRSTVEGIAGDGMIGRAEQVLFTQLPFAMQTKVPVEVATEDIVSIPVTIKNNTDVPLGGELLLTAPEGLQLVKGADKVQTIMPGKAKTIYYDFKVLNKVGDGEFKVAFTSCGLSDAFVQKIKLVSKGFPVSASMGGQAKEQEFEVNLKNVVNGSINASFTAYPNVVADLMKGVEGILREPYGCFEQTSTSAYPNAMVLDYLKTTKSNDDKTLAYAEALLDKGYKRLTTFETKSKGYEWFGAVPAHEGLTAYGIMEFVDMKKAGGKVDQKMIDRTTDWLLNQRDGMGGFRKNQRALDNFGRASDDITNAYIVYALSEAGCTNIKKEFDVCYDKAMSSGDAYQLAMMANAAHQLGFDKKERDAMNKLMSMQDKDGSWTGKSHSITYSQGKSLTIETTSIALMAITKMDGQHTGNLTKGVQYLLSARSGSGVFGSTQGTVLALKALTEYAKQSSKTSEAGTIEVYVDGKKVASRSYAAGAKDEIELPNLGQYLSEGTHRIKVKYVGAKNPLPYSVAVNWNTSLPESSESCVIDLNTKLSAQTVSVGETVRLTASIKNVKQEGIPSTMAIIGIPAGLSVQPWQLKELQEKKAFDFYEIKGNNLALYYRGMAPAEVKVINLDLKAEIPGEFDAPASSGYLYYTNEYKCWSAVDRIKIKKPQI